MKGFSAGVDTDAMLIRLREPVTLDIPYTLSERDGELFAEFDSHLLDGVCAGLSRDERTYVELYLAMLAVGEALLQIWGQQWPE